MIKKYISSIFAYLQSRIKQWKDYYSCLSLFQVDSTISCIKWEQQKW
ncbi:unnamed protein product [Paramecium sonneborni]|uniref:Uncharacterized protein n=1 Tax=Paramecium sonneborni TaxID=65129 RepID=A0A8S1RSR9_9CILI|nr:unnamed protein product [Paramecium sonneborni]